MCGALCRLVTTVVERLYALFDFLQPLALAAARLGIAYIFLNSGLLKLQDWTSTLFLFEHEYGVPLLPPELAAYIATTFELLCPALLIVGLFARLAALPLMGMTLVIEFTYTSSTEHYYWLALLAILVTHGAGKLSADGWFAWWRKRRQSAISVIPPTSSQRAGAAASDDIGL